MKKLSRLFTIFIFILAFPSVSPALIISHNQLAIAEEQLGVVPIEYDSNLSGDTVTFNITNNSPEVWTDYHIRIDRAPTSSVVNPFFDLIWNSDLSLISSMSHSVANEVDLLFASSILVGGSFSLSFKYQDATNMAGHIYYGTPTLDGNGTSNGSVPEPHLLSLMALGLLGFVATNRHRQKKS